MLWLLENDISLLLQHFKPDKPIVPDNIYPRIMKAEPLAKLLDTSSRLSKIAK